MLQWRRWYRVGTVAVTNGQPVVAGTLTAWQNQVKPGDLFTLDGTRAYEVESVDSNTQITLGSAYAGSTASGQAYAVARISPTWNDTSDASLKLSAYLDSIATFPLTTKGDLFGFSGTANSRLPVGFNGQTLFADSSQSLGLRWGNAREVLAADRTYHVSPSGNDSNSGLSAGVPLATIGRAYAIITQTLDLAGYTVTISLANGTHTSGLFLTQSWTGGGSVVLAGNPSGAGLVRIQTSSNYGVAVLAPLVGILLVKDLILQCGASGLYHGSSGPLRFQNLIFEPCGNFHIETSDPAARIEAVGNYEITGGAQIHALSNAGGFIYVAGRTITLTGTPAFSSAFVYATRLGQAQFFSNTYSGAATGKQWLADGNGVVYVGGATGGAGSGATALPGNVNGGAASSGCQFY